MFIDLNACGKQSEAKCLFFRHIFSWERAFLHQRLSSENKNQLNLDKYRRILFTWFNMKHKNEWIWSVVKWISMRGWKFRTLNKSIQREEKKTDKRHQNSVLKISIWNFTWFIWIFSHHTLLETSIGKYFRMKVASNFSDRLTVSAEPFQIFPSNCVIQNAMVSFSPNKISYVECQINNIFVLIVRIEPDGIPVISLKIGIMKMLFTLLYRNRKMNELKISSVENPFRITSAWNVRYPKM